MTLCRDCRQALRTFLHFLEGIFGNSVSHNTTHCILIGSCCMQYTLRVRGIIYFQSIISHISSKTVRLSKIV